MKSKSRVLRKSVILFLTLLMMLMPVAQVFAESAGESRWGDAADEIDKYLDAAFEQYLSGDDKAAYNSVNDAYFKIYEVTGFERQTMSYISGPRKNAIELQFSTCKAAVKKDNQDAEIQKEVRTELNKLKSMIREDGNKLAAKDGEEATVTKYYKDGELVAADPYAEYAGDPNAAVTYASWAAAAEACNELLETAFTAYKGKDFTAALDNTQTAYYMVYEESGLDHKLFTELSVEDRVETEQRFQTLMELLQGEKFQKKAVQRNIRELKNVLTAKATVIDEKIAEQQAEEAAAAAEEAAEEEGTEADQSWLTFIAAFGIIVREGLEAILVIAAIIAYLAKSGNRKSLKNVYVGGILGIGASFVAAAILYFVKQAWTGAGQSQEIIEGATALIAVCVLFYVSNWMISKSEAAAWSGYIDDKVQSSVERGSSFALAFTAFLAVFREGAEVVLFYQPMLSEGHANMVWGGFFAGCVLLVFVYLAITKLSIKLPIKVFFTATSILMAVMCVSFLGSGIKEFAEGGVFDVVLRVTGIPENDIVQIFGIYPYLETLVPQLILAVILLVTFMMAHYRNKLALKDAEIKKLQTEQ
ncbi:MAG: FTR1 family protein [Eubacteriales bacterium]|nr:FTR1 family protein [Eubacteriales bacterium]